MRFFRLNSFYQVTKLSSQTREDTQNNIEKSITLIEIVLNWINFCTQAHNHTSLTIILYAPTHYSLHTHRYKSTQEDFNFTVVPNSQENFVRTTASWLESLHTTFVHIWINDSGQIIIWLNNVGVVDFTMQVVTSTTKLLLIAYNLMVRNFQVNSRQLDVDNVDLLGIHFS